MTHGETKELLKGCVNIGQVDQILGRTYCKTDRDKADYLGQLFDVADLDLGRGPREDYTAIATAIVKHRVA